MSDARKRNEQGREPVAGAARARDTWRRDRQTSGHSRRPADARDTSFRLRTACRRPSRGGGPRPREIGAASLGRRGPPGRTTCRPAPRAVPGFASRGGTAPGENDGGRQW
jgi:hypothetical protein